MKNKHNKATRTTSASIGPVPNYTRAEGTAKDNVEELHDIDLEKMKCAARARTDRE